MRHSLRACFLFALFLFASPAFPADVPPSFADLVEKLTPAVVNISSTQKVKGGMQGGQMLQLPEGSDVPEEFRDFLEQFGKKGQEAEREVFSLGSGFVIDESGYIATNNHVVGDAEEITVILSDDTKLKAKIVGRDTKTDLALLKVDAGRKLPAVTLGDSDASRVGDWVIAIGNPFGLGGTVTAGIISARARNINAGPFDDFIQTDAAINRGNSGGPMFNMKGEVIGINTAIFSPSGGSIGIGFAVPTSLAKPVLAQLRAHGRIDRGWLGVKIQHVTDEIADSVGLKHPTGALVMDVTRDSPAGRAGVQIGDVILRFDGKEVKEMRNLPRMVADARIGRTVAMDLWRRGETKTVRVTLGELKEKEEAASESGSEDASPGPQAPLHARDLLGMSLAPLTGALREKYGIKDTVKGVAVVKLKPGSEAAKRGLQPGDIVIQIGDTQVAEPQDAIGAISASRKAGHKFVLLRVLHAGESVFVTLPLDEKK